MATCANCIHHSLCDYNTNISGNGKVRLVYAEGADVKCSFFQNIADVVPKSEVEKIFKDILNIIRNYSYDAMRCGNNYGTTQAEYIGIDILELKKKYTQECPKCKHFVGCEQANWERGCEEYEENEK